METLAAPFELLEAQAEQGTFKGRAAVYGREFHTMFGPLIIEPGAFSESLEQDRDRHVVLWQHDEREPIGRPTEIKDGPDGIDITGKLSQTTRGRDVLTLLRDRVVREMSIGLDRIDQKETQDGPTRLTKGKIWEFSLVTFGAAGDVGARVTEVHRAVKIVEPPLEIMRARVLQADLEAEFGKLNEEETILVSEIAKLCAPCAEKLAARGVKAVSVSEFSRVMELVKLETN
jgi:HK97 family phage prohead protease